jgi:ABC-2 type transport system ATP-binding protein
VAWVRRLLRTWVEEGRSVVVSSHLLAELAQVVDRVVIVDAGRRVAETEVGSLAPGDSLEAMFFAATGGDGDA